MFTCTCTLYIPCTCICICSKHMYYCVYVNFCVTSCTNATVMCIRCVIPPNTYAGDRSVHRQSVLISVLVFCKVIPENSDLFGGDSDKIASNMQVHVHAHFIDRTQLSFRQDTCRKPICNYKLYIILCAL